ncbi:MAG: hypothetical protein NVS3B5_09970 [Sphingomicrobium sp.]
MNMHVSQLTPAMGEFNVSNHLLGDHEALNAAWERDGYWFFRDVLDKDVIVRIRGVYADYLVEIGLADPADPETRYNGADYAHLAINSNQSKLNERKVDKLLHESPTINAFFAKLFGCDPFWVPFTVHRSNPPVTDKSKPRFDFIHADGFYNEGLPFLICWVPLDVIDEEVGGLAVVEGVHREPSLHKRVNMKILPIQAEDVPKGRWRRTTYRPGDVLLMSLDTPHSGLSNISKDRFRFSMDTRVMPSSGNTPYVGAIASVTDSAVTVTDANGVNHTLNFDDGSFVRGHMGDQMGLSEIPKRYHPGDEVIVMTEKQRVLNMRPQT